MNGRLYISSAFKSLKYAQCKIDNEWIDNDPHFWKSPPTWGICRTDYRRTCDVGDYVFFVLPKENSTGLQCIYGYLQIKEIITHLEAYKRFPQKRMGTKNPNGNIIVDEYGNYNKYDLGAHKERFNNIKEYYIIGELVTSKLFNMKEVKALSPTFNKVLNEIFKTNDKTNFEIISRKGRKLTEVQVINLLNWINKTLKN